MGAFSTQATVEARISAERLNTYTAFKTGVQATTIQAGIDFAWGYIAGKLKPKYGETIIDTWVLPDDVPSLVGWMSDSLCVYNYSISRPELFPENTAAIFDIIDGMLQQILDGTLYIYGADAPVSNKIAVGRIPSDYDPERDVDDLTVNPNWINPDPRELEGY